MEVTLLSESLTVSCLSICFSAPAMELISHTATTEKGNVSLASVNTPAKFCTVPSTSVRVEADRQGDGTQQHCWWFQLPIPDPFLLLLSLFRTALDPTTGSLVIRSSVQASI